MMTDDTPTFLLINKNHNFRPNFFFSKIHSENYVNPLKLYNLLNSSDDLLCFSKCIENTQNPKDHDLF